MIGCPTWDNVTELPLSDGYNVWHLKSRSGTPTVKTVWPPKGVDLFSLVFAAMVDPATRVAISEAVGS